MLQRAKLLPQNHPWGPIGITPYTQRPVEFYLKYELLPRFAPDLRCVVEDALGSNQAPHTARMHYLKRIWTKGSLVEVNAKLTAGIWAKQDLLPSKAYLAYRKPQVGEEARSQCLDALQDAFNLFIYEHDRLKLCAYLGAFDSLVTALSVHLETQRRTEAPPLGFPPGATWISFPRVAPTRRG